MHASFTANSASKTGHPSAFRPATTPNYHSTESFILRRRSDTATLRFAPTCAEPGGAVAITIQDKDQTKSTVQAYWCDYQEASGPLLTHLFVNPQYRQQGMGTFALAGIYLGLKLQGHSWVHANVYPSQRHSVVSTAGYMNFLSKMGFYQPLWARVLCTPRMVARIPNPQGEELLLRIVAECDWSGAE